VKKKIKYILPIIAVAMITVTVYAATYVTGSFSLGYGNYNRSGVAKLQADYPYVKYTGQSSDYAKVSVTLTKKGLININNVQRIENNYINGNNVTYVYFNKQANNNNYYITTVNESSNTYANAKYLFSSKSTYGNNSVVVEK